MSSKLEHIKTAINRLTVADVAHLSNEVREHLFALAMVKVDWSKNPFAHKDFAKYRNGNQKIQAIKLYRELTGAGLADAKRAVEDHFGWHSPVSE